MKTYIVTVIETRDYEIKYRIKASDPVTAGHKAEAADGTMESSKYLDLVNLEIDNIQEV